MRHTSSQFLRSLLGKTRFYVTHGGAAMNYPTGDKNKMIELEQLLTVMGKT